MPRNWLIKKTKAKDGWECVFPSENEYTKVKRWVKNQKTPKRGWPTFSITVLSSSGTKMRLKISSYKNS